jgi:hypothetical protein
VLWRWGSGVRVDHKYRGLLPFVTLEVTHITTWRHPLEELNLQQYRCESLRPTGCNMFTACLKACTSECFWQHIMLCCHIPFHQSLPLSCQRNQTLVSASYLTRWWQLYAPEHSPGGRWQRKFRPCLCHAGEGGLWHNSTDSYPPHKMEGSCQLHTLATFPPGTRLIGGWVGPRAGLGVLKR